MNEWAVKILLALSALLGTQSRPADSQGWKIERDWEETTEGYLLFAAESRELVCQCQENPAAYIEFPTTIHSSSQVLLGNQIIATTSSPDFQHTKGFYGSLTIPCYQIMNSKAPITWKVWSYTQYFARFKYFPKLVESYPKQNFFGETLHIGAAVILIILCLLYLVIFTGKISKEELFSLVLSNIFTAIYFMGTVSGLIGFNVSMLTAHKIADTGVWMGLLFFIHFLYRERLILRWMNIAYKIFVLAGLVIIVTGETGDIIQLGTTVPFLFTMVFISYAVWKLADRTMLSARKNLFQFIGLSCFLIAYSNDVFVVTGVTTSFPLLPLGIIGSYVFILLSVNERITQTYTERDELKVLTAKLEQANTDLGKTQDELVKSEKMAALGRAVARIAHELNTPIGSARLSAENILIQTKSFLAKFEAASREKLKALVTQYYDDMNTMGEGLFKSVNRAAVLISDFKQISSEQTHVQKKAFELLKYIKKSVGILKGSLKRKNIEVNFQGDEVVLHSDAGLFHQIIENLMTNVLKYAYGDEGGRIDITLKSTADEITLLFADYGKGIPEENVSKIFDAFFTTGGGKGGTGLGLNIVYRIVTRQLKGTITCESTEGQGTTFTLTIPKNH